MFYDEKRVALMQEALSAKPISSYLADWGAYSETNKYSCIFQEGEDIYPSLFVDDTKNVFYCHSCHRGGGTGKLISYKMEQDYGIKNYFQALEKYLNTNTELQRDLGFNTLITNNKIERENSLEDIENLMVDMLHKNIKLETMKINISPRSTEKDFNKVLAHCIKVQNEIKLED